jgi:regulator of protease activity HflC (stomatin/prohibitin superfamily)
VRIRFKKHSITNGFIIIYRRKLQAEQDAMRMEFVLQQEKLEAERIIIEAKGTRDAQNIISEVNRSNY